MILRNDSIPTEQELLPTVASHVNADHQSSMVQVRKVESTASASSGFNKGLFQSNFGSVTVKAAAGWLRHLLRTKTKDLARRVKVAKGSIKHMAMRAAYLDSLTCVGCRSLVANYRRPNSRRAFVHTDTLCHHACEPWSVMIHAKNHGKGHQPSMLTMKPHRQRGQLPRWVPQSHQVLHYLRGEPRPTKAFWAAVCI